MTRQRSTARVRRIAAFLFVMAVQFGIFEVALRLWGSSEAAPAFQGLFMQDPDVGFRLKPGARTRFGTAEFETDIAINNAGVRDSADLGPRTDDERRVVILGDSLVLSVQVPFEQTFGELLEARLNARQTRYRYRVINAGVQGYGPVQERLFFRKVAASLDPDVVLVSVFVGNDAEEAFAARAALNRAAQTRGDALRQNMLNTLRRMVRRSMVLQVLRLRVTSATERFTTAIVPPEPPLQSYAESPAPRIQEGIDITRDCVRDIAAQAAALGARTGVVLMPARFQVDDADYGRLKSGVEQAGGQLLRDAATKRFEAAISTLNLPMADPLAALRAAASGPDLFFERNVHLTPRGHEVMAEVLERFLERNGLLDDGGQSPGGR
jgi:lysophospholipase L1-like esterase